MKQKGKTRKKRDSFDCNTAWKNSLKEIGRLLPVSGTASGRALTKKETLIHMLQYFDFLQSYIQSLQSSLPSHCLPVVSNTESESETEDTPHSEPGTPPHLLKAKRKYSCTRSRKKTTSNPEPHDARSHSLPAEDTDRHVTANTNGENPPTWSTTGSTFIDENDSSTLTDSFDSYYSLNALPPTASSSRTEESSGDQESPCQGLGSQCSVCEDRTGSEDGSLGSKDPDTPPSGSFLLKDRMLGILPSVWKKQLPNSHTLPQTPVLPLLPLLGAGERGLNLSPSLLTSPTRGLSHPLVLNRKEELQTLFEDVWVTPVYHTNLLMTYEEDDSGLDDTNRTPKQHITRRTATKAHRRRFFNKSQDVPTSSLKTKCVNGFIMFCRVNRRLYLRTHPGTPSTVVTKELAKLWHVMPKQERRLYCLKARQFSRQHKRNVRSDGQEADEDAEDCVLTPLHMLLAHRDLYFASS